MPAHCLAWRGTRTRPYDETMGAAFPNPENPGSDKKAVRLGNRTLCVNLVIFRI